MKRKSLIIVSLAAMTALMSCGGGSTNQNNAAADSVSTSVDAPQTDTEQSASTEPDELSLITCEVLKYLKNQTSYLRLNDEPDTAFNVKNITDYPRWTQDSPDPKTSRKDSSRFYVHLDGGFDNIWEFSFRKRNRGGYWVFVHLTGLSGDCGDCEMHQYTAIYYVDGSKDFAYYGSKDPDYALPRPKYSDFYANSDKFPEDVRRWLDESEKTKLDYKFTDGKIEVTLNPYYQTVITTESEEDVAIDMLPKPLMGLEKKNGAKFPTITYVWDGDRYVVDPKFVPLQEDLKYLLSNDEIFAPSGKYPIQLYGFLHDEQVSEADINGDGISDMVICDNENKEFAVYFKNKQGVYNRQIIGRRPPEDDGEGELSAGAMEGGIHVYAFYESSKSYDFRYERGDFFLYKFMQSMDWPDGGGSEYYEIDFVKHKVIDNDTSYSVPAYPLMRIADVPLGWWTITEIYEGCDMTEIWKQIERRDDDDEGIKVIRYSYNNLEYAVLANDGHCSRSRTVHCYDLDGRDGYMVIDVYSLFCETQSGVYNLSENTITQYTFENGKLTKIDLQEELKPYSKEGFQTSFENKRGYGFEGFKLEFMTSNGSEAIFVWNGTKFEKK